MGVGPDVPEPLAHPNQTRHPRNRHASNERVRQARLPVRAATPMTLNANRIGNGRCRCSDPSEPRNNAVTDCVLEVVPIVSITGALPLPGVTEFGENWHAAPCGRPAQLKLPTAELNGAGFAAMVTMKVAEAPALTGGAELAVKEKSVAFTTCSRGEMDELAEKLASPVYVAVIVWVAETKFDTVRFA